MSEKKKPDADAKAPAQALDTTPDPVPEPTPDTGRYLYTGGTTGTIVLDGRHVADVFPGLVIKAEDDAHAKRLVKTGHFEPTTKRATKVEPEDQAAPTDAAAPAQEA